MTQEPPPHLFEIQIGKTNDNVKELRHKKEVKKGHN